MKSYLIAFILVFVAWFLTDFLIHGIILKSTYAATAALWRPEAEMNRGLATLVTAIAALAFTGIYGALINPKSMAAGIKFGMLYGLAAGVSMGLGSYCYMPISIGLALMWFVGTLIQMLIAGAIVGTAIKTSPPEAG